MRVKVGNTWHEANSYAPIMVELTDEDKIYINSMDEKATKFAVFHPDTDLKTPQSRLDWMK